MARQGNWSFPFINGLIQALESTCSTCQIKYHVDKNEDRDRDRSTERGDGCWLSVAIIPT